MQLILSTKYLIKGVIMTSLLQSALTSTISEAASGVASKVQGALSNLANPAQLASLARSINLPIGGEVGAAVSAVRALMGGTEVNNDWRVRLSIPAPFLGSAVLQPLKDSDFSLIFPYTPTIQLAGSAGYDEQSITHQNYQFINYQNSKSEQIQISAPFNVEDSTQALYWLAAVHFFRSATKMFTGEDDPNGGNPPPILRLNGYGDYVFKNIPVVVKAFSFDLPQDVNYINTSFVGVTGGSGTGLGGLGSAASGIGATANKLAGLAGSVGLGQAASALGKIGAAAGAVAGVGAVLGMLGGDGSFASGNSWVPTKSTLSVTLQPIYSRTAARNFSLTKFVNGDYVKTGYL
jgi:hypothetical protein